MVPLVSIIIPVYNAENYLAETISSAINQTWANKEIIIINDGSIDNSLQIAKSFESDEVKIIDQNNKGACASKQVGFDHSLGSYIQYLDADDLLHPDKICLQVEALDKNEDSIAICRTAHFLDTKNHLINNLPESEAFYDSYLDNPLRFLIRLYGGFDMIGSMIQPNAFLIPRHIAEKAGKWDTDLSPSPDEDGEYFCRIILASKGICYQPQIMNYYRKFISGGSLSRLSSESALRNLYKSFLVRHKEMLASCTDESLVPNIHTVTYRGLFELYVRCYPNYKVLYKEIEQELNKLLKPEKPYKHILGGKVINNIANRISWKLARRLQNFIAKS